MRCTATLKVPTQAHLVRCDRDLGHDLVKGDAMHHGVDDGPGGAQRNWLTGKAGDGR